MSSLTIVAATHPEAAAVRRALAALGLGRSVRVVEGGIALARLASPTFDGPVISCGVAGGLRDDVATGTLVVPDCILLEDGRRIPCDADLTNALLTAAAEMAFPHRRGVLLTAGRLIVGDRRRAWAAVGCIAADMETGLVRAPRLAAVRSVLDTPSRELSPAWLNPRSVLWHPEAWGQAAWLARNAPRCAQAAAQVAAAVASREQLWMPVDEN